MISEPFVIAEGAHIDHFGNMIMVNYVDLRDQPERNLIPLLVKGCRTEHAIENGATVQISTPQTFRNRGENLIRDSGEGYHYEGSTSVEVREFINTPEDMAQAHREDGILNRAAKLIGLGFTRNTKNVREKITRSKSEHRTFDWTPPGWLFCTSIRPNTDEEWQEWWATMEPEYDHVSCIHRPREFARALGSMAVEQIGPQGETVPHTSTFKGWPPIKTQHPTQMVFHGPVVYTDHVMDYFKAAQTELDFALRTIFVKNRTHESQREYRFLVYVKEPHSEKVRHLTASPLLLDSMSPYWMSGPPVTRMPEQVEGSAEAQDVPWRNPLVAVERAADLDNMMHEYARNRIRTGQVNLNPNNLDPNALPDDLESRTATYASVEALQSLVHLMSKSEGWNSQRERDLLAAAWCAEQGIRSICAALGDSISGIHCEDDCLFVCVNVQDNPDVELFMIADPWGNVSLAANGKRRSTISLLSGAHVIRDIGQQMKNFIDEINSQTSLN